MKKRRFHWKISLATILILGESLSNHFRICITLELNIVKKKSQIRLKSAKVCYQI